MEFEAICKRSNRGGRVPVGKRNILLIAFWLTSETTISLKHSLDNICRTTTKQAPSTLILLLFIMSERRRTRRQPSS
jgi:hypothetical protein